MFRIEKSADSMKLAPRRSTTISRCLEGDRRRYGRQGWKEHLEALVKPLRRAADVAEDLGIPFGIENHQDICSFELRWLNWVFTLGNATGTPNAAAAGERAAANPAAATGLEEAGKAVREYVRGLPLRAGTTPLKFAPGT